MTQTPPNIASVLTFPIQIRETDDTTSDNELVLQTRLVFIKALNDAAAGRRILSEETKTAIREGNELFKKWGYSSLSLPF